MFGLYLWRKRINQNNKICYEQNMAIILHLPKIPTPTQIFLGLQSSSPVYVQYLHVNQTSVSLIPKSSKYIQTEEWDRLESSWSCIRAELSLAFSESLESYRAM